MKTQSLEELLMTKEDVQRLESKLDRLLDALESNPPECREFPDIHEVREKLMDVSESKFYTLVKTGIIKKVSLKGTTRYDREQIRDLMSTDPTRFRRKKL